jgi:DNA-binding NtrC family response regulator
MSQGKILAIDDEPNIRHLIRSEFSLEGFEVITAENGEEGLKLFDEQKFDLVLLDIKLPQMNGIDVLRNLKQKDPSTEVIMITAYGDIKTAVESMKLGARDYITKPFKLNELLPLVREAIRNGPRSSETCVLPGLSKLEEKGHFIRCPNQSMQEVYALIEKVALTDKTVLLQGETGVGKDILALQIHLNSDRKNAPLVCVDCGLLAQNLAESELYGHCKGAFSGASEKKIGLVERSHGGTLFLNEIGNIDPETQKKFLQFLETRKFRRIGETKEIHVDTRIILATNLDLRDAIQKGTMRKDLFYRMDVISIHIPPLAKHPECIPRLAKYFLKVDHIPNGPTKISPEATKILTEYSWPGNVRELKSVITKAMIFADSDVIAPYHLPSDILGDREVFSSPTRTLEDMEKEHIMAILEQTGGNQSKAAEILGINRKTLYKKIHKYGLFS